MGMKSIVSEAEQIQLAAEMVHLGARLQMLESETSLSRERLLRLYKEIRHESPPKGMLPYSTDWFLTWLPNAHASLFVGIHRFILGNSGLTGVRATLTAYRLYLEHIEVRGLERVLSLTRAWRLVKFIEARMLRTAPCTRCGGEFVVHTYELYDKYVCGLCNPPSRAGQRQRPRSAETASAASLH